jgi:hypothetical protein
MDLGDEIIKGIVIEAVKWAFTLIILLLTWLVGQRILALWDYRKKSQEWAKDAAERFENTHGEWKAIWRLWKAFKDNKLPPESYGTTTRWELLTRAAAAEGQIEALLMKLAFERHISHAQRCRLGLFRQAYQTLREAIRDGSSIDWTRESAEYWLMHELSIEAGNMLLRDEEEPGIWKQVQWLWQREPIGRIEPCEAQANLSGIIAVNRGDWKAAVQAKADKGDYC